mmetsp:Transcript_6873/g.26554  ORF Transcript_6873/g.26554 Transcript_6873/m.26554 type:complete len:219 (+) Transcript_6873:853-1509(+)
MQVQSSGSGGRRCRLVKQHAHSLETMLLERACNPHHRVHQGGLPVRQARLQTLQLDEKTPFVRRAADQPPAATHDLVSQLIQGLRASVVWKASKRCRESLAAAAGAAAKMAAAERAIPMWSLTGSGPQSGAQQGKQEVHSTCLLGGSRPREDLSAFLLHALPWASCPRISDFARRSPVASSRAALELQQPPLAIVCCRVAATRSARRSEAVPRRFCPA